MSSFLSFFFSFFLGQVVPEASQLKFMLWEDLEGAGGEGGGRGGSGWGRHVNPRPFHFNV